MTNASEHIEWMDKHVPMHGLLRHGQDDFRPKMHTAALKDVTFAKRLITAATNIKDLKNKLPDFETKIKNMQAAAGIRRTAYEKLETIESHISKWKKEINSIPLTSSQNQNAPGASANPMLVRPEDILRGPPPLPPQARAPARKSKGNEQPEFSASPNDSFAAPSVKRELVELRRTLPDSKVSKFLKNEFIKNVDGKWFAIRGKSETKKTADMLMNRVDRLLARIAQRKLKNNGEIYSDNSKKTDLITCMFPRLGWAIPAKWLSDMAGVKTEAIFHYEDRPDSYGTLAGVHIKPPGKEFNIPGGLRRKFGTAEWIVPARDRFESLSPNYIHMVEFDGEHLEPDDLETIRDSIALHSLISYASSKPYEKRLGANQKIDKLQKAILIRFQEHLNATKSKPR